MLGLAYSVEVQLRTSGLKNELFEGSTIILGCVNGTNTTSRKWYKNNVEIRDETNITLTLNLRNSSSGLYTCGIAGKNSSNNFTLVVRGMSP